MTTERAEDTGIRIITEKVHEGSPGEGWAVGYEYDNYTNLGWFGKTRLEAFLRLLRSERRSFQQRATAIARDAVMLDSVIQAMIDHLGINLELLPDEVIRANQFDMFGATRIRQVEEQRNEWQSRLVDGHRCEHRRTCLDNCFGCPDGQSVGGPACAFDDKVFWADFENGRRR